MKAYRSVASVFLACSLVLSGCATTTTQPKVTIANTKFGNANAAVAKEGTTVLEQAAFTAAAALFESAKVPADRTKAIAAFRTARALLDHHCNEYLDALGSANQRAGNERKQTGLIGGFASTIMGLTGSSAKEIAGVASAFSFTQASMDAFMTSYLFSDAASSITKLVRDSQSAYLRASEDHFATLDYPGAVSLLGGYEQICRPAQIRSLIDQAIAAARIVTETPGALPEDASVITLLNGLTGALGAVVTEGDAIALYAWFVSGGDGRASVQGKSQFVQARTANADTKDALESKVSSLLTPITLKGSAIAKRWAPAIAKLTGAAPPAAPEVLLMVPTLKVMQ
jgi:hypothetical protein